MVKQLLPRRAMDGWVTVPQAAAMLGVSERTMGRLLDQGVIAYSTPSVHRRIRRGDVLDYLRQRTGTEPVILHETGSDDPLRD